MDFECSCLACGSVLQHAAWHSKGFLRILSDLLGRDLGCDGDCGTKHSTRPILPVSTFGLPRVLVVALGCEILKSPMFLSLNSTMT